VWQFLTDVSGQRIGPIINGQEVQKDFFYSFDFWTFDDGTGTLCRNVGKQLPFDAL
jgi:hypothetical protein